MNQDLGVLEGYLESECLELEEMTLKLFFEAKPSAPSEFEKDSRGLSSASVRLAGRSCRGSRACHSWSLLSRLFTLAIKLCKRCLSAALDLPFVGSQRRRNPYRSVNTDLTMMDSCAIACLYDRSVAWPVSCRATESHDGFWCTIGKPVLHA